MAAKKKAAPKLSPNTGTKIDALFQLRTKRLAEERKVEELKAKEAALKEEITATLGESNLTKAAGKIASFSLTTITVPRIDSDDPRAWQKVYRYIAKHEAFDLLQKRWNEKSYRDRVGAGEKIPGAISVPLVKVSLTAVKR